MTVEPYTRLVSLSATEIEALITEGENERTEFKAGVPDPRTIAQNLAALANASGGRLILGVSEDPSASPIRGIDVQRAERAIQRSLQLLEPTPAVDVERTSVNGKDIVVVTVRCSDTPPVLARGVAYVRQGGLNVPATSGQLLSRVGYGQTPAQMQETLERFSRAIEQQGKLIEQLVADSGFRSKLMWMLSGGVVGAILGAIPQIFFD